MTKQAYAVAIVMAVLLLAAGLALAASAAPQRTAVDEKLLLHTSQVVAFRYWLANPDRAPAPLQERFRRLQQTAAQAQAAPAEPSARRASIAFNFDEVGFPQNEESITVCQRRPDIVLGGTNDYRGLLDPQQNFTGWHLSTDNGNTLAVEGLLPPVTVAGNQVPSGGDPVSVSDRDCNLFAASLNYDPSDPFGQPNGIGVYRSDPETLAACGGGSNPDCWPARRAVAESEPSHFLDKEWIDVGRSGDAGDVVWAVYSDFVISPTAPLGFESASIQAVRCDAALTSCTDPILISGDDPDVQFGDVTIGPDGRTYITWAEIIGELTFEPQTFVIKLRIAPPGSTDFGPEQIVFEESLAIPFGGLLHANDFRVATYPKNEVVLVGGHPRVFVVWDACAARPLGSVCEEPQIKLRYTDDDGANWSPVRILSRGGDNYFPAIAEDGRGKLALAWFTNRYDPRFHNRQDVELVFVDASSVQTLLRSRLTEPSNETEADPLLGGVFIGDYIEVAARRGRAWVHYNANHRQMPLLGEDFPVAQQDNFLRKVVLED